MNVAYRPDAPAPELWLRFLSELLEPEDIPTLQEYLGYCLLPTTKGQKMLMLNNRVPTKSSILWEKEEQRNE